MTAALAFALAACLPLSADSERILPRDLLPGFPALAAIPDDTPLAPAPEPGLARVFHLPELRRWAARWRLPSVPEREICVVKPVAPLNPATLLGAMQHSLPEARIEILDFSRRPAPQGALEMPLEGLRRGVPSSLWTGSIRYAGNRRFIVWVRVTIATAVDRVLAVGDLAPGQAIASSQVILQHRQETPGNEPLASSLADVIGKSPRQRIRAGTAIRLDVLDSPKDVMRGETVRVEIRNGGAILALDGEAEASGAVGATIPVLNRDSRRRFLARVEGKGKVAVSIPPSR